MTDENRAFVSGVLNHHLFTLRIELRDMWGKYHVAKAEGLPKTMEFYRHLCRMCVRNIRCARKAISAMRDC